MSALLRPSVLSPAGPQGPQIAALSVTAFVGLVPFVVTYVGTLAA